MNTFLNRLDGLPPWTFTGCLYLARWFIVLPIAYALGQLGVAKGTATFEGSALVLLFGFLLLAPLLETLLECVVPYWAMMKVRWSVPGTRPWAFVVVSALIMALLHVGAWPAAIVPSVVTGSFLAYTYGHFAAHGVGAAILHTCAFHAAINAVGWLLIFAV